MRKGYKMIFIITPRIIMQPNTPPNYGGNSNNMMEMLKTQMMTMMMINSANAKSGGGEGMYTMLYVFIVTGIIDFFCKQIGPNVMVYLKQYYSDKMKSNKLLNDLVKSSDNNGKNMKKTASITIQVNIADHQNIIGQSLLDYITNNKNTKHISYKKQNFILNELDVIEISDEYFIKLTENKMAESADASAGGIEQTVELFSYTRTMKELRSFLDKVTHEYKIKIENKLGDKMYYFNQHPMNAPPIGAGSKEKDYSKLPPNSVFTMKPFQTNRKFSNLFGPEIEVVRKRVDFFMKNRKWYDAKGIPYTLGLLLSGQAGAGKTSSIKCLANETRRHIININLNNDITKTQLENLFFNEMLVVINVSTGQTEKYYIPLDQRIYVLEDIDCQSDLVMERSLKNASPQDSPRDKSPEIPVTVKTNLHKPETYENKNKNPVDFTQAEKIDLSFLLNLLDGVLEIPGRIVIMTSNYPKMLDHALVRPGRIDVIADFKRCSHQTIIQMMEFFYDIVLTEEEKQIVMETKEESFSPAEMGKLMFENFGNYKNVLETLSNEYTFKDVEENIVLKISTLPTDVFVENTCEVETGVTLIEDIPTDVTPTENITISKPNPISNEISNPIPNPIPNEISNPIPNPLSRISSCYNREYEIIRDNMGAHDDKQRNMGSMRLLEFKAKLTYDATYAKTEKEKGYAVEMQKQLELLENKMNNMYELEKKPFKIENMQSDHLDKFEKSSAQEMLHRVDLLKTLSDQKSAEKGGFVGAFSPSNPQKTWEQVQETIKDQLDIKKGYGWDAYGDRGGFDSLDGMLTGDSCKYAEFC